MQFSSNELFFLINHQPIDKRLWLPYANLTKADLMGADLSEAKFSKNTIWPKDFDPVEAGAILTP